MNLPVVPTVTTNTPASAGRVTANQQTSDSGSTSPFNWAMGQQSEGETQSESSEVTTENADEMVSTEQADQLTALQDSLWLMAEMGITSPDTPPMLVTGGVGEGMEGLSSPSAQILTLQSIGTTSAVANLTLPQVQNAVPASLNAVPAVGTEVSAIVQMPLNAMQQGVRPEFLASTVTGAGLNMTLNQAQSSETLGVNSSTLTAAQLINLQLGSVQTAQVAQTAQVVSTADTDAQVSTTSLQTTTPLTTAILGSMRPALNPTPAAELPLPTDSGISALNSAGTSPSVAAAQTQTLTARTDTTSAFVQLTQTSNSAEMGKQLLGELKERIQLQIGSQQQTAQIRLDPPRLGAIDIRISVEGDRTIVQLHASQGVVREAMQQTIEQLRTTLVGKLDTQVDVQLSHGGSDASGEQQRQAFDDDDEILANTQFDTADSTTRETRERNNWVDRLA